jgi:hypothetical protein
MSENLTQATTDAGTKNSQPQAAAMMATPNPSDATVDCGTPSETLTQATTDPGMAPQAATPAPSGPAPGSKTPSETLTQATTDAGVGEPQTAADELDTPRILTRVYLLPTESLDEYEDLRVRFFEVIKPQDIIEEMYAWEFMQREWEILRERRLASGVIWYQVTQTLHDVLYRGYGLGNLWPLISAWSKREAKAVREVTELLKGIGLNVPAVIAKATAEAIDNLDRLDAMTTRKAVHRDAILRDLDRRRVVHEQQKKSSNKSVGADFKVIEVATDPPQLAGKQTPDIHPSADVTNGDTAGGSS